MPIKELLQALVMAETQDERMNLVEQNGELMEGEGLDNEGMETLQAENEQLKTELQAQKQKFIDRFFGGNPENPKKEEKKEPEKSDGEKKAETISTDDLVKEMGK